MRSMTAAEQAIADKIQSYAVRGLSLAGRSGDRVYVIINGDGSYGYVSGPEKHQLGTPRRMRKVFAIRQGVRDGCAHGGFGWAESFAEAVAKLEDWCTMQPYCVAKGG